MGKVHVVPNPYRLSSGFDRPLYAGKIGFYGLPAECTIRIFDVFLIYFSFTRSTVSPRAQGNPLPPRVPW